MRYLDYSARYTVLPINSSPFNNPWRNINLLAPELFFKF